MNATRSAEMDEQLNRILYNLEVSPPEQMWGKISAVLEDEITAEFPSQLYHLEIQPPASSWNAITASLDYSDKLYDLEIQPPVQTWQKIASTLNDDQPVRRIVPMRRIALWKYAVAASVFALIGFGVKWLTADTVGPEVAVQPVQGPKAGVNTDHRQDVSSTQPTNSAEQKDLPAKKPSNNLPTEGPRQPVPAIAKAKVNSKRQVNYMTAAYRIPKTDYASSDEFCMTNLQTNAPGHQPRIPESAYRYLIFENDNCDLVRMSKKLAEKLGCSTADPTTPEYQNCLQQLKKWSEKIAQMNITPSPDNFMNIFELLKSTEDKQF